MWDHCAESRLLARKLGESRVVVVAAPSYLAEHGTPRSPNDLTKHNMLGFCFSKQIDGWPFRDGNSGTISVSPVGNLQFVSDGEAMQKLAAAGAGLARLARFHVDADIKAGRLTVVLEDFNPGDLEPVHAVFLGHGGHLPARVRAFSGLSRGEREAVTESAGFSWSRQELFLRHCK